MDFKYFLRMNFAPFGYSGEVNKGFYLKRKISKLQKYEAIKMSVRPWRDIQRKERPEKLK